MSIYASQIQVSNKKLLTHKYTNKNNQKKALLEAFSA